MSFVTSKFIEKNRVCVVELLQEVGRQIRGPGCGRVVPLPAPQATAKSLCREPCAGAAQSRPVGAGGLHPVGDFGGCVLSRWG